MLWILQVSTSILNKTIVIFIIKTSIRISINLKIFQKKKFSLPIRMPDSVSCFYHFKIHIKKLFLIHYISNYLITFSKKEKSGEGDG